MYDDKLFKFQQKILRALLEKECLGPGFVSIWPMSIIIQETSKIYIRSKLYVISKYVMLVT